MQGETYDYIKDYFHHSVPIVDVIVIIHIIFIAFPILSLQVLHTGA